MAKMFYTLDEAANRLNKSPDEIRAMAESNQLSEFRDGDKLIYKVDQVDLMADDGGGDVAGESDLSGMISLQDTGGTGALTLEETGGSFVGLADSSAGQHGAGEPQSGSEEPGETVSADDSGAGITVLDDEVGGDVDASADTLVTDEPGLDNVNLESFGSGSGLMDLTRESDDTSLGADGLLDELYSGGGDQGSSETATAQGDDLFEGAAAAEDFGGAPAAGAAAAGAVVAAQPYDGQGSGLAGGLALGMVVALAGGLAMVIMALMGGLPSIASTLDVADLGVLIPVVALLGATVLFGAIGFVFGGKK